jgi:hypothetical protein
MITRFDKLETELPHPDNPSHKSAAAVQELLGGKFGEMSTFSALSGSLKRQGTRPGVSIASSSSSVRKIIRKAGEIWNGPHPEDGSELQVQGWRSRGLGPA